jgi:CDP-diacylglycerol--glycerol-3-phosphate 3-phosphatidyltransferase
MPSDPIWSPRWDDVSNNESAIATWANAVTAARVLIAPVLWVMIPGRNGSWPALALWFALSASDFVDGWLARRHGATRSGAFLDPLADKILVLGAMFILVHLDVFRLLPVAIIATREIAISLYRSVLGTRGISVPASKGGKLKTFTQQLAVAFALCPATAEKATWTWNGLLWIAVVLTVGTGLHYLIGARRLIARQTAAA